MAQLFSLGGSFGMNNNVQKNSNGAIGLIVLAWITSVISLPIYLNAMIGFAMSCGRPFVSTGERVYFAILVICPILILGAIVFSFLRYGFTGWRFASAILPCLLGMAELAFIVILLAQGLSFQ